MKRTLGILLQVICFLALVAAAGAVWFNRDYVTQVLAAFYGTGAGEQGGHKRGGYLDSLPVVVKPVGTKDDDVTIEAIATARAKRSVTLFPEASGEIEQFNVAAGDRVEEGSVILKIEAVATELAVDLAKNKLKEAERNLKRSEQLMRRNVNSQAKVDDTITMVERSRVELKQAQETRDNRILRAPFAGVVGIPKVELGDRVTTTTEIITLDDRSELLVELEVPEEYLSRLKVGEKIVASTPSYRGREFKGRIVKMDSRIDPTSRTITVRASLRNDEDMLRPGMSFSVNIYLPGDSYPTIPELALQWVNGQSYVWRVADGKAEKVDVKTVKRLNATVLVKGDLNKGDLVVVEGVQRLRAGSKVTFPQPDAQRAPST